MIAFDDMLQDQVKQAENTVTNCLSKIDKIMAQGVEHMDQF